MRKQLAAAGGQIGYTLRARPLARDYWTLSVWTDSIALREFMRTPPARAGDDLAQAVHGTDESSSPGRSPQPMAVPAWLAPLTTWPPDSMYPRSASAGPPAADRFPAGHGRRSANRTASSARTTGRLQQSRRTYLSAGLCAVIFRHLRAVARLADLGHGPTRARPTVFFSLLHKRRTDLIDHYIWHPAPKAAIYLVALEL